MTTAGDVTVDRVRETAARVAADYGLELFDLQFRREAIGWVLRVVLDRPAPGAESASEAEVPVGIDDCRRVSQDLSALFDVEGGLMADLDQAYTLEVSSPGLDRPLRGAADYRRFVGRLATLVTRAPIEGQSSFSGRLAGLDHDVVLLQEGRRRHRVPLDLIRRAHLEVEF